jgi:hypothetical protein
MGPACMLTFLLLAFSQRIVAFNSIWERIGKEWVWAGVTVLVPVCVHPLYGNDWQHLVHSLCQRVQRSRASAAAKPFVLSCSFICRPRSSAAIDDNHSQQQFGQSRRSYRVTDIARIQAAI